MLHRFNSDVMKYKILILLLVVTFAGTNTLSAQMKQAAFFFQQYKYSKAIPLYKKATEDKEEKVRKEATARLADCFRLINNSSEASIWYAKAVEFTDVDPVNYYYLGMALRTLSKYDEAEKAFQEYGKRVPGDFRGKLFAEYCKEIRPWEEYTPCAEVKNAKTINSVFSDFGPYYYQGQLLFTSDRDLDMMDDKNYLWTSWGYLDLYTAAPSRPNDFWNDLQAPEKLPNNTFNQPYHDGPGSFTADNLKIFLTRTQRDGRVKDSTDMRTNYLKIYFADLSNPKKVVYHAFPYNNENYSVGHPAISADGKKLIFSSNKPGGAGQSDLYISELVDGNWTEPVSLGSEINTFGNEVFPFFANDSTLFFASDGHLGYGGLDIFQSNKVNGKWLKPWNLKRPINSAFDDFSIVFDATLTEGFFSSNRLGGIGSDDIYAFRNYMRTPSVPKTNLVPAVAETPKVNSAVITGLVKNKTDLSPIAQATVFVLNTSNQNVLVLKTDSEGRFEYRAMRDVDYTIKAVKAGYFDDCLKYALPDDNTSEKLNLSNPLLLDKYKLNQAFEVENIYYDLNKWDIREDAKPSLDELVRLLKQNPISVELGSHTDCRASTAYNNILSQKRAESAVKYLVSKGISPDRLTAKGYGETKLKNKCADGIPCSEAEHQANRRTEFKVTSISADKKVESAFDSDSFKVGEKIGLNELPEGFFNDCK